MISKMRGGMTIIDTKIEWRGEERKVRVRFGIWTLKNGDRSLRWNLWRYGCWGYRVDVIVDRVDGPVRHFLNLFRALPHSRSFWTVTARKGWMILRPLPSRSVGRIATQNGGSSSWRQMFWPFHQRIWHRYPQLSQTLLGESCLCTISLLQSS